MASLHIFMLLWVLVVCLLAPGRSEPIATEAILCLSSTQGNDAAVVTPKRYTHEEGYDVCIKYQTATGTAWTWAYGATSSARCAQMMHQTQQYKDVQCCMQRNCNTPDPVLDPKTQVVFPAHRRTRSHSAATDQPLQAKLRSLHQHISRHHLVAAKDGKGALTCYRNLHNKALEAGLALAVTARTYRRAAGADVCVRYYYKCAEGDLACSSKDLSSGVWKWMYAALSASTCLELKDYSNKADALIKHVQCCTGALCNKPDGKLDSSTKVVSVQPTAATHHKQTHTVTAIEPAAAAAASITAPAATVAAGKHKSSTALAAIRWGGAVHTQTSTGSRGSRHGSRLACYSSLPTASGQRATVETKVYKRSIDGVDTCSRYQVKCSAGKESSCTAADINSSSWVWEYKPLSGPTCREMQVIAATGQQSGYKNVVCCSSSLCNKPDRTLDKATHVRGAISAAAIAAVAGTADIRVKPVAAVRGATARLPGAAVQALPAVPSTGRARIVPTKRNSNSA